MDYVENYVDSGVLIVRPKLTENIYVIDFILNIKIIFIIAHALLAPV